MITAYKDLGTAVNQALRDSKFPASSLKKCLAVPMGLSPTAIPEYLRHYSRGLLYGTTTSNPQNPNTRLERLAIFLYALGFSEEDEMRGYIIAWLRNIAKENGHQFEYPPALEMRVSYDRLREEYESMSGNRQAPVVRRDVVKKRLELGEKVNLMLSMGITTEPDSHIKSGQIIKREVVLVSPNFGHYDDLFDFVTVIIKVEPQKIEGDALSHNNTYRVTYPGTMHGNGEKRAEQLNEFINFHRGQKTHIYYTRQSISYSVRKILQMIEPIGSDIVFVRGGGPNSFLEPYRIKP